LSPLLFNLYSEYITQEALEGFGDFKVGGQIINMVRYADDLRKLIEVGRGYGIEINVEKTKTEFEGNQPHYRLR
jgi:hypothetical protein